MKRFVLLAVVACAGLLTASAPSLGGNLSSYDNAS